VETSSLIRATYDRRTLAAAPQLLLQSAANCTVRRRPLRSLALTGEVKLDAGRAAAGVRTYCGVVKPSRARPTRRQLPGSPFNVPVVEEPVETFAVGDLVTHDKYGLGSVIGVEDETVILIDFGTHRVRILLPCAKLIKL
jgi:hypothetical protein